LRLNGTRMKKSLVTRKTTEKFLGHTLTPLFSIVLCQLFDFRLLNFPRKFTFKMIIAHWRNSRLSTFGKVAPGPMDAQIAPIALLVAID